MSHPIRASSVGRKPTLVRREAPAVPQWPSYTGTSQFVGTSPTGRVSVFVDPAPTAKPARASSRSHRLLPTCPGGG